MIRFLRVMLTAGLGFLPVDLLAASSASIRIGGVVYPVAQTTVLAQPLIAEVSTNPGTSVPVAIVRCGRALIHQVIVESSSRREVLQGTSAGQVKVYLVNCPRNTDKVCITIVGE